MREKIKNMLTTVVVVYFLVVAALYLGQRKLMYFPTHWDVPARGVVPFAPWTAADGSFLGYVRDADAPRRVVVLFHGNGGEAIHRAWLDAFLPDTGVVLVLAEHPGFGARTGELSEESLVTAGLATMAAIAQRWTAPITVMGESLGTGVACAVAGSAGVDRLALISPFSSALDVGRRRFPIFPLALLMKDSFRSDERLKHINVPLHVIHGVDDDIVPFASGEALVQGYAGPKTFTPVAGAKHNDMVEFLMRSPEGDAFRQFVSGDLTY